MLKLWFLIGILIISINIVNGLYLKNKNDELNNHGLRTEIVKSSNTKADSNILNLWIKMKSKLSSDSAKDQKLTKFNATEALLLIPSVIEKLRAHLIASNEKKILSSVYGSIWPIIEEESVRSNSLPINPILQSIFNGLQAIENPSHITNDYEHNSLNIIKHRRKESKKRHHDKLNVHVEENDDLSQKVLKTAALLIRNGGRSKRTDYLAGDSEELEKHHEAITKATLNSPRTDTDALPTTMTLNLNLKDIPISGNIFRHRRSIQISIDNQKPNDLNAKQPERSMKNKKDLPAHKIDDLLNAYRQKYNLNLNETNEETSDENAVDKNYDDLYEDDEEAPVAHRSYSLGDLGSFQDLIMRATTLQKTQQKDETKLLKSSNKNYFIE